MTGGSSWSVTGSTGTPATWRPAGRAEALVAAVAAAHAEGARVTAHCFGEESLRDFAAAGIDGIEHATRAAGRHHRHLLGAGHRHRPDTGQHRHLPGHRRGRGGQVPGLRRAHARPARPPLRDGGGRPRRRRADLPRDRRRRFAAARARRGGGRRAGQGRAVGRRGPGRGHLGSPPLAAAAGAGRGRERRPGRLPGRPAQGHRGAGRAVARASCEDALPAEPAPLRAESARIRVGTVEPGDLASYPLAVEQSRARLSQWNPVDPDDLGRHLAAQSRDHRTFVLHARAPQGSARPGRQGQRHQRHARDDSCPPRWATTPTTRMPGAASSPRACGWSWGWSSPRSRPAWGCTASRPTCSRATPCPQACCGRWASSTQAASRGCCGCPTRAAGSAGATTTPT